MPVIFPYWLFALLTSRTAWAADVAAPDSASIMSSVPARYRGAASGMRATIRLGTALSIGVFFSLMIAGLAASLPQTLARGLFRNGVPSAAARPHRHPPAGVVAVRRRARREPGRAPAVGQAGLLAALPQASQEVLTGRQFFPELISGPFHQGLVIALSVSAALAALGAGRLAAARRPVHPSGR